jgi:hypothetical protein
MQVVELVTAVTAALTAVAGLVAAGVKAISELRPARRVEQPATVPAPRTHTDQLPAVPPRVVR